MNSTDRRIGSQYYHVRGVGGSTLHFSGEAHRLHPAAMHMHSRFGVAADWPLDYAELEPFFCEVERIVGVAGPNDDPVRPRSEPYPLPAHRLSYASDATSCRRSARNSAYGGRPTLWPPYPSAMTGVQAATTVLTALGAVPERTRAVSM